MAYKPTRKRKYGIQPVQNVSSGGMEIAQMLNSMSADISNFGTNYRKAQFNEAKLDAEAQAKISSVNYTTDKDGKMTLQNLTNFNYANLENINDARDRKSIAQFYKNTAIAHYVNAKTKDMDIYAGELFAKNPLNYKGIMNAKKGYIDGMEIKDEQLKAAIIPNVEVTFARYANQAKANFEKQRKANAINDSTYNINLFSSELKSLYAAGITQKNGLSKDQIARIDYIRSTEIPKQKAIWLANGKTEHDFNKMMVGVRTEIKSHTSSIQLEFVVQNEGLFSGLNLIENYKKSLKENPKFFGEEVNPDDFIKNLTATYKFIGTAINQKRKEDKAVQTEVYNKAYYDIETGSITSKSQIDKLNTGIGQKAKLLQILVGKENRVKGELEKINTKVFLDAFNRFLYPKQYADGFAKSPDLVREEASHEIRMLNADGLVKSSQWGNFLKSEAKIISDFLKASSDNFVAKIQFALSENSGYEQKPSFFRNEINNAIKNGVIKSDKINTVNGYLNSYTKRFKAEHEKRGLLIQGANLRLNNIPISDPKIKSAINKEQGNIQIEFIGSNGALQKDVPNILDVDEIKREASIKKTVENSYSKGVLHPHLKDVFNSTSWLQTEDDFKLVMSAWKSYMMHAVNKDRKNGEWEALSIAKQNGVNVVLMQQAHLYGFEHTKKLSQGGTSSSDRKLSALGMDGANFDERFMDLFNEVIVDQSWYEWVFGEDYVTSGQRDNLNIYNTQTGTNSLSGALMSNPRVKNLIMNKATAIFNSNKYAQNEEGMKLSIVSAMSDLSGTIGLQDMPNGTKEWTMFPIVTQAKASAGHVPIDWDNETWKKRIITDAIEKSQIKNAAYSPKMIDAINDGKLVFIVNETYGSKPDYSVFVEMDNERHKILNNYSYNFFKSNDHDDYNSAINQIENSWWRNLIASIPGAKPWIVDQTVSDWAENNDFDSTIKKLVYAYNTMGSYINMKYPIGTVDLSSAPIIASAFENDAQATVKPDRDYIHKFTIPPITKKDRKAIEAWLENWVTGY